MVQFLDDPVRVDRQVDVHVRQDPGSVLESDAIHRHAPAHRDGRDRLPGRRPGNEPWERQPYLQARWPDVKTCEWPAPGFPAHVGFDRERPGWWGGSLGARRAGRPGSASHAHQCRNISQIGHRVRGPPTRLQRLPVKPAPLSAGQRQHGEPGKNIPGRHKNAAELTPELPQQRFVFDENGGGIDRTLCRHLGAAGMSRRGRRAPAYSKP